MSKSRAWWEGGEVVQGWGVPFGKPTSFGLRNRGCGIYMTLFVPHTLPGRRSDSRGPATLEYKCAGRAFENARFLPGTTWQSVSDAAVKECAHFWEAPLLYVGSTVRKPNSSLRPAPYHCHPVYLRGSSRRRTEAEFTHGTSRQKSPIISKYLGASGPKGWDSVTQSGGPEL
ncbi:hypothetical protein MRX96_039948 [Rhipicephalus microplus]